MKRALILSGGGARGAFQVGVWKYLQEKEWIPDLISGTSIGAINAAAIVSGMPVERLIHLWTTHRRAEIYRFQLLKFLAAILFKRSLRPMLDTDQMPKPLFWLRNWDRDHNWVSKSATALWSWARCPWRRPGGG